VNQEYRSTDTPNLPCCDIKVIRQVVRFQATPPRTSASSPIPRKVHELIIWTDDRPL